MLFARVRSFHIPSFGNWFMFVEIYKLASKISHSNVNMNDTIVRESPSFITKVSELFFFPLTLIKNHIHMLQFKLTFFRTGDVAFEFFSCIDNLPSWDLCSSKSALQRCSRNFP